MRGFLAAGFVAGLLVVCLIVSAPASAGVSVSVFPETTRVEPDEDFTVYLWIDVAGDEFDAYQTVINWNNDLLTLNSAAQETVMTDACGNNWWRADIGDSVFITHAFLCPDVSVTGPGAVSSLSMTAQAAGTSEISFEYIEFFLSGILNPDVTSRNGVVTVGGGTSVPEGGLQDPLVPSLDIFPNPVGDLTTLRFDIEREGPASLGLYDVQGREILSLVRTMTAEVGRHSVEWGPHDVGLSRGVYFWRLQTDEGRVVRRMIVKD